MARGWLCLQKRQDDYVAAREGYGDDLGVVYSWDDRVPNAHRLEEGHYIALWDSIELLGLSVIERITKETHTKSILKCPVCEKTDVRLRKLRSPRYRCGKCHVEFDDPIFTTHQVRTFAANYEAGWTTVVGLDAKACRALTLQPKSQHSIRPLDLEKIEPLLSTLPQCSRAAIQRRATLLPSGHRQVTVRARIGQERFRRHLLDKYESRCAFTGAAPALALQAAHLYRYADLGEHKEDGGLLLRADVHLLFDKGLITVNPTTKTLEVAPEIESYHHYARLHGRTIDTRVGPGEWEWLKLHWQQHRGDY